MEKEQIVNDSTAFENQKEFSRKERIFTEVIFGEPFLEFFEKTTKELLEEDNQKNQEIYKNLMRELEESIQQLKEEHIDVRVLMMVFVKEIAAVVMDATCLEFRSKL